MDELKMARDITDLIRDVILAERERCANIAQSFPANVLQFWDRPGGPPGNGYRPATHDDIAAAIRATPEPL